jgi:hypothetical protein
MLNEVRTFVAVARTTLVSAARSQPWIGDLFKHPLLLYPGVADHFNLVWSCKTDRPLGLHR